MQADGGSSLHDANYEDGGGGGGGRIALYFTNNQWTGALSAKGAFGATYGGAGTIYQKAASQTLGTLMVDNGGSSGALTPIPGSYNFDSLIVTNQAQLELNQTNLLSPGCTIIVANGGYLHIDAPTVANGLALSSGGRVDVNAALSAGDLTVPNQSLLYLSAPAQLTSLLVLTGGVVTCRSGSLAVLQDAVVNRGGAISADLQGYGPQSGPGAGAGSSSSYYGAGGGYGGRGGDGISVAGGTSYGSPTSPLDPGSGGGTTWPTAYGGYGGVGGGVVHLNVGGTLRCDGAISSNGESKPVVVDLAYFYPGGGAGGSIYLTASTITGSGTISADGGYGDSGGGGGGGGGRVALYFTNYSLTGLVSANGGSGWQSGQSGTIYTPPHSYTLVLNKQILGFLQSPFSADQWTFSAAAGQQVRLEGINTSAPTVAFDLLGPSGWIGFSNVASQSDLVTLPSSGGYTLVARSTGMPPGKSYTCRLQETAITNVVIGTPFTGTLVGSAQAQLFVITNSANMPMRITLINTGTGNRNELYASFGVPPTRGTFDYRAWTPVGANQQLLIPGAYAGNWYVLVYGDTIATPGGYTIQVDTAPIYLQSLTPAQYGNAGTASIDILGAGFDNTAQVSLVGGTTRAANNVTLVSGSHLIADIDVTGLAPNTYQLTVSQGTNVAALPFQVTWATMSWLWTHLTVPSQLGRHAPATIYIEYANTGNTAMPAPLLVLTASQPPIMYVMPAAAGAESIFKGYWTPAEPIGWSEKIQVLAYGQTPGLLQPGESNTIAIAYAGLLQPWDFSQNSVVFTVGILTVDNTTAVDWGSWKTNMQPTSIPNDAWDALWANFLTEAGTTWGDYVRMLNRNATYLRSLGLDVKDLNGLLGFAFAQADSLNIVRTLASSTDASVPTPGLSLSFSRFFPQSIYSRYRLGALGRGWTHNWDLSLSVAYDIPGQPTTPGTVTVTGPGGSQRIFQPDSRTAGAYFSQADDHGVLTQSGGTFTLTEPHGLVRVFTSDGKLAYAQDPNGNQITAGYSGNLLTTLTHSSGQSLTLAYGGNLIQSITDSFGRTTSFAYDAGQHLQTVTYFDRSQVAYSYVAGQGAGSEHALAQIAYPGGTHQYFTYDSRGRPASTSRDGGAEMLTFGYEGGGNVDVTDASANIIRFYLDNNCLLAKAQNSLTNAIRLVYDTDFNLTSITDPAGRSYGYTYDDNGNLTEATDPLGGNTRFLYGTLNRLAVLTDAKGNLTRYTSDPHGNLTAMTYADNSAEHFGYDGTGDPITWTNRRSNAITCQFDAGGQLTAKQYPDGRTINYDYDAHGLLTSITDSLQGIMRVVYDEREFVTNITYPDGRGFSFTYDSAGRRTSRVGLDGYVLNYGYDVAGRLVTLTDASRKLLVNYTYDEDGRLSQETKGNGTVTTYAYNGAGQFAVLANSAPGGSIQSFFNYSYDAKGNRLSMTSAAGVTAYAYDDLNQLIRVNYPSGRQVSYIYDAAGNRTSANDTGTNVVYTLNGLDEYTQVGTTTYGFDSDGNMTNRTDAAGTTTYQFDAENRLVGVTTPTDGSWQYIYDALGNRSAVVHNGVTNSYLLDPFGLVDVAAEYDAGGNLVASYSHGLGLVARSDSSGNTAYYSFDALGNTRQVSGDGGAILNLYDYDAFGTALLANESVSNAFRFVGRFGVTEDQSVLHFMRARYYMAALGRFNSCDPLGLLSGDVNSYRYCVNTPIAFIDPDGLAGKYDPTDILYTGGRNMIGNLIPVVTTGTGAVGALINNVWGKLIGNSGKVFSVFNIANTYKEKVLKPLTQLMGPLANETFHPGSDSQPQTGPQTTPTPQGSPGGSGTSGISTLEDPNHLTGPAGYSPQNYVQAGSLFSYRIDFEITNALAVPNFGPAQVVIVSDPLTNTLDWTTLQFTEVGFGSQFFAIPPGTQHYEQTAHVSYSGVNFDVQVEAGLNPVTGVLTVSYESVDPRTGLPPQGTNGIVGFLQPEDGTGRGMGHVSFLIRPKPGLPTGTAIRNVATISYDAISGGPTYRTDLSIATDPNSPSDPNKQALVTIDANPPTSAVTNLLAIATNAIFTVSWSGSDVGAGVSSYDVYAQTNHGPWNLWLASTPATSAIFQGQDGQAYCFYTIAHDGAGNLQTNYTVACTQTMINYPPVIEPVTNQVAVVGGQLVVTNSAYDPDGVTFSLDASAPAGATITTNGIFKWTPACAQGSSTNLIIVWGTDGGTPPMSNSVSFLVTVPECIEASVGSTIMLIGQTNSIPINLLSTTALTNMAFTLVYPADRFTNFALTVNSPQVLTQSLSFPQPGQVRVSFTLPGASVLHGPTNVGQLGFTALPNQSSAFVPLPIMEVNGLEPDGSAAASAYGQPGRVVVVGPEPLLEAGPSASQNVLLTLYGQPSSVYQFEWKTNLLDAAWQPGWSWMMSNTNVWQTFEVPGTNPAQFFRALRP